VLESLAQLVDGDVADGRLHGSCEGYGVEAWSTNERPAPDVPAAQGGSRSAGPRVNVFHLMLAGVPGRQFWDCRSTPSLLGNAALVLPWWLAYRLITPQFAFERPKGGWLAAKLGVPAADETIENRLREAGLFDELSSLRWGSNPFLPKATFNPHAQAIDATPRGQPGELAVQAELGKHKAPSEEQFRELLDRAARIARLNAEANA